MSAAALPNPFDCRPKNPVGRYPELIRRPSKQQRLGEIAVPLQLALLENRVAGPGGLDYCVEGAVNHLLKLLVADDEVGLGIAAG